MIGERLKQKRLDFGLTQKDMAEKIGIPRGSYEKLERDEQMPGVSRLQQIAKATGVSIDWLLGTVGDDAQIEEPTRYLGKYLVETSDGRYICRAKYCAWRDKQGFCAAGAGCLKEWQENREAARTYRRGKTMNNHNAATEKENQNAKG